MSTDERQKRREKQRADKRQKDMEVLGAQRKVRNFLDAQDGFSAEKMRELRYLRKMVKGKDNVVRPELEFGQRHLSAMGKQGRDEIRAALDDADKREGMPFIDRSKAMKLERLREAKKFADEVDNLKENKYGDPKKVPVVYGFMDKFRGPDKLITFAVSGLSLIFVLLMFRFLFYPLFVM